MDLGAVAREIIDETLYMVLGTADADGEPWVSPVYCASAGYAEFYWISSPEVIHSRNIAVRPKLSIVVFDSRQRPGSGRAVYMEALAGQVAPDEVAGGLAVYNGRFADPAEHGLRDFDVAEVSPPAEYRLYRATVSRYSMVCPREAGRPCAEHGRAVDHRTEVTV
ncbi:MAG TPA: pyridoxamine 5'-phosphate oxidase family protein [Actinophytocola sp.]|uniref:pyridoxamine 5'-phosphate oxidase family protein n=1 Tax=Actinophytocola sp. TaxID=1872138 RepID=UPI002DDCA0AB|nr:pyridoxamine 5'-phosphate oxidase family protein [Actinophytocola sp.]HEV2782494.1 pyridoxamine 5'-phosphate oxidase family protein [Actinophytocola sp.]